MQMIKAVSYLCASIPLLSGLAQAQNLPYATQRAAQQFPVTLYTSKDCANPCSDARTYLQKRGVPYTEKVVNTQQMLDELKKISTSGGLPVLLIGRQALNGFSESAWNPQLELAGYPKAPLPSNYRPQVIEGQEKSGKPATEESPQANKEKYESNKIDVPKHAPLPPNAPPGFRF